MKTLVIYYTLGGATRKEAEKLASERGADLCGVREARKRNLFSAFIPGAPSAMRRKSVAIQPLGVDLNAYDRIVIGCPVWAGYPAPAFNAIAERLPSGKEVEIFLCSGGGETPESAKGTKELIQNKGCTLISYRDVKTAAKPAKARE